jgi:uncharacterized protein (TIRG00374 family)
MKIVKTVLRITISVGLLGYLIYHADPLKILNLLNGIWQGEGTLFLFSAVLLFILAYIFLAVRWQVLVKGYGLNIPTYVLFKYYLIGLFFNNFLPTGIGGDVMRIYNLIRNSGERTIGFASVMTERLMGITATLILSIGALLLISDQFKNLPLLLLAVFLLIFIILFFFLIFQNRFFDLVTRLVQNVKILRLGERILKFLDALRFYRDKKIIYLKILLITLFTQTLLILMTWFLTRALALEVPLYYLFFVVPVTFLLTMLPSINGLGVREGGFVILLGKIGISEAAAVSLSFLSILIPMIISVAGGILFMMQKKIPDKKDIENVEKIF